MRLTARHGNIAVSLHVLRQGRDLLVMCSGGQAHIGAVAVASPRSAAQPPTIPDSEERSEGLIVLPGHREDLLAARMARRLADALHCTVCVSAGIHFDAITKEEIARVLDLTATLTERCVAQLQQSAKDTVC